MTLSRENSRSAVTTSKMQPESSKQPEENSAAQNPTDDDLPALATYAASTREEKIDALKLITDSVAQQRQTASKAVLFHPACLALWVLLSGIVIQSLYKSRSDLPTVATTLAGITIVGLFAVRYFTDGYIQAAEEIKWDWLGDDQVIVTKWGEAIIGALVLGRARDEGKGRKRKGGRGQIRAWTVKLRYRGRGVGTGLLEQAVDAVSKKGGDGIEFADDHAHSTQVLKPMFNGPFTRIEQHAQDTLDKVVAEKGAFSRSRRQRTP